MKNKLLISLLSCAIFSACEKTKFVGLDPVLADTTSSPISSPAKENFESGVKSDYSTSTIVLTTGKWLFDNAVIGIEAADKKNGNRAARLGANGKLAMNFNVVNGVYQIAVSHASYGTDGSSDWGLFASNDNGITYTQVGNNIASSSTLKADTFFINVATKVRFQIRKVGGAGNQLNIDDIEFIKVAQPPVLALNDNDHMLMGNPSRATYSVLDYTNYLMRKSFYALSYNRDEGKANWVSWHLNNTYLGTTVRSDAFTDDQSLPGGWYRVTTSSYSNGGFDRGHYCPSGDRNSNATMNQQTFLMTNIMPQAPQNNQRTWAALEDSCRRLATLGNEMYIISGSYGSGGEGNNGYANSIDNGNILVPATLWKVVVVLSNGNGDLSRINNNTRVIAVSMPNINAVNTDWKGYRTSVRQIEQAIGRGFNLLSNLPQSLQDVLETRIDNL